MKTDDISLLLDRLLKKNDSFLQTINYEEDIAILENLPVDQIHPYKISRLSDKLAKIKQKWGAELFEDYREILILDIVLRNWNEIFSDKYPKSVQEQFKKAIIRFRDFSKKDEGWTVHKDDVYWKDLAIARQAIFPAGAQIVEAFSGFGFKGILTKNVHQFLSTIQLLIKLKGRKGLYQIHTHTPDLAEFNEEGWDLCYLRIAEMLEKNKNIKGFFGASWFYDPHVLTISPRLTYLQKRPLENGASLLHYGRDFSGAALAKSNTRRNLYNEGKYTPQIYILIWPRKPLLNWAQSFKNQIDSGE